MGKMFDWKSEEGPKLDWKHGDRPSSASVPPKAERVVSGRERGGKISEQSEKISPDVQRLLVTIQNAKEKISERSEDMRDVLAVVSALEKCEGEFDLSALDAPFNLHGLLEQRFRKMVSENQVPQDERDLLLEKIRILDAILERLRAVVFSK